MKKAVYTTPRMHVQTIKPRRMICASNHVYSVNNDIDLDYEGGTGDDIVVIR